MKKKFEIDANRLELLEKAEEEDEEEVKEDD
jgi:hypothetical protein